MWLLQLLHLVVCIFCVCFVKHRQQLYTKLNNHMKFIDNKYTSDSLSGFNVEIPPCMWEPKDNWNFDVSNIWFEPRSGFSFLEWEWYWFLMVQNRNAQWAQRNETIRPHWGLLDQLTWFGCYGPSQPNMIKQKQDLTTPTKLEPMSHAQKSNKR